MLQYYINRIKCGDKEKVQDNAPNHSNSDAEKPYSAIKKSTLQNFKKKLSQRGKQVISVLYDYVSQMQNEDTDCGNVPRSKKQLIDLSHSSLMVTEVGDILACNKELNIDSIVWHHSDIPELETKTKNIAVKMSNNITLSISVDITFNLGAYSFT